MMRLLLLCISIVFLSAANACELVLAKDSVANCVIVKGNDTKFCQLGVELLQRCLQSSTGAKFKVVSSSDNIPADTLRIVVGWGEDAQKAGFDVSRFAEEEYMITVKDKTLFLLGKDGGKAKGVADFEIIVAHRDTARIQEAHTLILHALLEVVEREFPA